MIHTRQHAQINLVFKSNFNFNVEEIRDLYLENLIINQSHKSEYRIPDTIKLRILIFPINLILSATIAIFWTHLPHEPKYIRIHNDYIKHRNIKHIKISEHTLRYTITVVIYKPLLKFSPSPHNRSDLVVWRQSWFSFASATSSTYD